MSSRLFSMQELANIAYLTGAEVRDLYLTHVANVHDFNRTYPNDLRAVETRADSEILKLLNDMRADVLKCEFIDDTLSVMSLLRYNADETLADEALTRIEALGFRTYRMIELHGKAGFRDQRRQDEFQERFDRHNAKNWRDGVDDQG